MNLEDSTFMLFAAKHYDNPHCHDTLEFEEDLKRFQYLRKLLSRYATMGELKERLILNHLIVLFNCFGPAATPMLFLKLEGHHSTLRAFVEYLNYMPEYIEYNNRTVSRSNIPMDQAVTGILRGLVR